LRMTSPSTSWKLVCDLSSHVLDTITRLGFNNMTPVQVATIPVFMRNKDVCVEAVTGSGKTLAFVVPMIEMLMKHVGTMKKHHVRAVIVSPTRELASQIHEVVDGFLDDELCPFTSSLLIGGTGDIENDISDFTENGSNIIVGTPGRISFALEKCMMLRSGVRSLEVLILDEADRLLDLGFHKTLSSILGHLPKQRRTGLFSATQTTEVEQLMKAGMRNPVKISVKEVLKLIFSSTTKTPSTLQNYYCLCPVVAKFNSLMEFVSKRKDEKLLLFFSTCASVDYFGRGMKGIVESMISCLHMWMLGVETYLNDSHRVAKLFGGLLPIHSGILVCTDVMARGIDIPDVDWVLQYDPPSNASAFVHRCGRTARVGRQGNALLFLLEAEATYVDFIEINQKAPMLVSAYVTHDTDWLSKLRGLSLKDRAAMDRGTRAFVSFVQSYAKHQCNLIFRVKDLNFGELATSFGLLKIPKMPEIKANSITGFKPANVDIDSIKFKDKAREKQRRLQNKRKAEEGEKPKFVSKKAKAWSGIKEKKELRREKKEKRKKQKE
uniref:ATP-dependent RNA helicase n=1 Tax=Ciona savignyi TaxID=51511 RepID=H2YK17_CIOSA